MEKRYVVEAKDESGWFDYDRFDNSEEAIALAKQLPESGFVAVVVDIAEMTRIYE